MIGQLTGILAYKSPAQCMIDVGGVGYSVSHSFTTFSMLPEIGLSVTLAIHTYVREDQLVLYGFAKPEEKALFQRLISVSGVGPKMAMAMLSGLPAADLIEAIGSENGMLLATIPGVGRKTADRIIVELKDKISRDIRAATPMAASSDRRLYEDAVSALVNLGYQRLVAEKTLKAIEWSDKMPIENIIRAALQELCRA